MTVAGGPDAGAGRAASSPRATASTGTTPPAAASPAAAAMPIVAPSSGSAAIASDPDLPLDGQQFHIYEAHPAPWWIAAIWIGFFVFAIAYLITNLLQ